MMSRDSVFKKGDSVFDIRLGWGVVDDISEGITAYPIWVNFKSKQEKYTPEGKFLVEDRYPTLSLTEYDLVNGGFSQYRPELVEASDYIKTGFPKVMWVWHISNLLKVKRVVFAHKNGKYLSWYNSETIEDAERENRVILWDCAEDIIPPLKLTLEQVAEEFGVKEVEIISVN